MSWNIQKNTAMALQALQATFGKEQRALDGWREVDIFSEGWKAVKEARDAAFRPPWIERRK